MSEENIEVVRKAFDAFNAFARGELEAPEETAAELVDPQIEHSWHDERTFPDEPQQLRGIPELIGFWEQLRGAWVDLGHRAT